jgi:hypothetical protein
MGSTLTLQRRATRQWAADVWRPEFQRPAPCPSCRAVASPSPSSLPLSATSLPMKVLYLSATPFLFQSFSRFSHSQPPPLSLPSNQMIRSDHLYYCTMLAFCQVATNMPPEKLGTQPRCLPSTKYVRSASLRRDTVKRHRYIFDLSHPRHAIETIDSATGRPSSRAQESHRAIRHIKEPSRKE